MLQALHPNTLKNPLGVDLFDYISHQETGQVYFKHDPSTGLKAIIGIHSTQNGPALGGCRLKPYGSTHEAIHDALRLSRAMSLKAAIVGLPLGGGKAVLIEDPSKKISKEAYFKSFGKFVHSLNGQYITAVDSGTTLDDMDIIATETSYVAGTNKDISPSVYTAEGVFIGIKAALKQVFGSENLSGRRIAIQGVGEVGYHLCSLLAAENATLILCDPQADSLEQCKKNLHGKIEIVSQEAIYSVPCDVFSPCALGAVLNEETIPQLQTRIIAGAANNQLSSASDGLALYQKGILYAPDYVINAGGLIFAANRYLQRSQSQITASIEGIYDTLSTIFHLQNNEKRPASILADELAFSRLNR